MAVKITVDATGMKCPMPLLKAKQALNKVSAGEIIEVLATDRASMQDIQAYVAMSQHELMLAEQEQGVFRYQLKKSS